MDAHVAEEFVRVTLSHAQLRLLAGCVNEALEAVDDREFVTRLGVARAAALQLHAELNAAMDGCAGG